MRALITIVLVVTLAGCATSGRKVTQEQLDQVVNGQTTRSELVALLGPPTSEVYSSDGTQVLGWGYAHVGFMGIGTEIQGVSMIIGPDGTATGYSRTGSAPLRATPVATKPKAPDEPRFKVPVTMEQEEAAKTAVRDLLKDSESARFDGIYGVRRAGHPDTTNVCGNVNAKNSYGGYVGSTQFVVTGKLAVLWDRNPKYGYSVSNSTIDLICTPTTSAPAQPATLPTPVPSAAPSAAATAVAPALSREQWKTQQLDQLQRQNLSYEEYQKRYRQIVGE